MKTTIPKSTQHKDDGGDTRQRKRETSALSMVDNRPEAVAQTKLINMIRGTVQRDMEEDQDDTLQEKSKIQLKEKGAEVTQTKNAAQRMTDEEDKTQMKAEPAQLKENTSTSSVQATQCKENKTGMPDNLKSGLENLSGMSMDSVKVHYNSPEPAQLNAHAFTQGSDIHVASGQEKHLAHEGWHVVQQAQGRVQPTMQMAGTQINDDAGLEKEADVMGRKAAQLKSLEAAADSEMYLSQVVAQKRAVVQRVLNLGDMKLAIKIGAMIGKTQDQVFKIMLAIKMEGRTYEDNEKRKLAEEVSRRLGIKAEEAQEYDAETEFANTVLSNYFESSCNRETLDLIARVGSSEDTECVVLYRGANPVQALNIMAEQTYGGAPEIINDLRDPPTEAMQILQTGQKLKKHLDSTGTWSTLEEWSRGTTAKESFSKDGWILKCIVLRVRTNYDDSVEAGNRSGNVGGELGVVAWVETPCLVAIEKKGAALIK